MILLPNMNIQECFKFGYYLFKILVECNSENVLLHISQSFISSSKIMPIIIIYFPLQLVNILLIVYIQSLKLLSKYFNKQNNIIYIDFDFTKIK